ncbi:hypothetical protein BJ138DRAFT_1138786 [Hygrophoropsis aurantiaca]|uniref:Uncharacterized protein n=1 Tax=Hygrophoropsis aurantiaca TaxID=72124 RepID=A0ACB7ZR12_9AGAM|nr:hypothetical protein BJ138DRAFT_1138786 [Hygrophoropsis aurantiaca]
MHVAAINVADELIPLWRGSFRCDPTDNRESWDWAVLQGDTWKDHGDAVAAATPFLPGSFDRPPRNPAEKINSGYKAWEYLLYLFGLGPALLYGILPDKYWKNFCKLVRGIRLMQQHEILSEELVEAHHMLIDFEREFEEIYYQRRPDRLHFIRPWIHSLGHLAPETLNKGPPISSSQWTMERTIGNLGQEIRSHSQPYANLSQRGVRRCQINALKILIPLLEPPEDILPRGSIDLGQGYVLLRRKERSSHHMRDCENTALLDFLNAPPRVLPPITRWARLRLPNGQIARSLWKESAMTRLPRISRNVKWRVLDQIKTLALVSLYSPPNLRLLEESCHTLYTCEYQGDRALCIVDTVAIKSVVAMIPHALPDNPEQLRFFLVEKPGLDVAYMGGAMEHMEGDED